MLAVRLKKKMEPFPLYNRARVRHATKTNCGVSSTHANYQAYWKKVPEVHLAKPASSKMDVTPVLPGDAQAHSFRRKPKIPRSLEIIRPGGSARGVLCWYGNGKVCVK